MILKSVYLQNYLGILEGMNRSEIYIDFMQMFEHGLRNVLFLGRNGVGKSVLINSLTPFPSQGDERQHHIVPGKPGRKIIEFVKDDGTEIKCDIRWRPTGSPSCFIYLNGSDEPTRETAKGNVGEYLNAVKELMGVTPDYLKIGRIGSRVSSFIEMKARQRKDYIGQFMPEIEEWAAMHKNVAKRIGVFKQQLQGLQVELDRIRPASELQAEIDRSAASVIQLTEHRRRIDTATGQAQGVLSQMQPVRESLLRRAGIDPSSDDHTANPVAPVLQAAISKLESAERHIEKLVAERPRLKEYTDPDAATTRLNAIKEHISKLQGERGALISSRSLARGRVDTAQSELDKINVELRRVASVQSDLANLTKRESESSQRLKEANEAIADLPEIAEGLTYEEVKTASELIFDFHNEVTRLRGRFSSQDSFDVAARLEMDSTGIQFELANRNTAIRNLRERLSTTKARLATTESHADFYRRFSGMHCNDSRCPYERYISEYSNAANELEGKKSEIAALEERIEQAEAELNDLQSARTAAESVLRYWDRLIKCRPTLVAAGVWDSVGSLTKLISCLAMPQSEVVDMVSVQDLLENIRLRRVASEAERIHNEILNQITVVRAREGNRGQLEENKVRAEEVLRTERLELEKVEALLNANGNGEATANGARMLLESMVNAQNTIKEAKEKVDLLTEINDGIEEMAEQWNAAINEIDRCEEESVSVNALLSDAESAANTARRNMERREEYEARLAELAGCLQRAQQVADACHPAKGAPVEFLRDFLDVTRNSVNDLLDVALQGEFRIGFKLTDSEFTIPVAKGSGRVIDDVTEASEGQIALAKTVLSLALIKQTVQESGFNIVTLDEPDGMLDKERNRERFAEIVDRLSMELGLQQLFMISHNDNFQNAPAALVLMPGHAMPTEPDDAFMSNKLVLVDWS